MRNLVIKLYSNTHFRDMKGKQAIRRALEEQGYDVKSEFDGTLSVYEKGSKMTEDALFLVLLCAMVVGYIVLLYAIVGGLVL